LQGNAETIGMT